MLGEIVGLDIDAMDTGEDLAALVGQGLTHAGEFFALDDTRAQGFAGQPCHDEAIAETIAAIQHVQDLGGWHRGCTGERHEPRFDGETGATVVTGVGRTARRAS